MRKLIEENVKLSDENQRQKNLIDEIKIKYNELENQIDIKIDEFKEICVQNKKIKKLIFRYKIENIKINLSAVNIN